MVNNISAGLKSYAFSGFQKMKSIGSKVVGYVKRNQMKEEIDKIFNSPYQTASEKLKDIRILKKLSIGFGTFSALGGALGLNATGFGIAAAVGGAVIASPVLIGFYAALAGLSIYDAVQHVQAARHADRKMQELNNQGFQQPTVPVNLQGSAQPAP